MMSCQDLRCDYYLIGCFDKSKFHIRIIIISQCYTLIVKILIISGVIVTLLLAGVGIESYGHTTVYVEEYEIETGWGVEPPIVGIRNDLVIKIIEPGGTPGTVKGVTQVFGNVDASVSFGGASKSLDINSDVRPGYYFSPIIPTKTGSYSVSLQGQIQGTPIDVKIPIEDVEPTGILDFPPTGSSSSSTDIAGIKNAISAIQHDVSTIKSGQADIPSGDGGAAYEYAIFGMSIAVAAIILAVVAMVKRR